MSDDRKEGDIKVNDKRRFKVVDGDVVKTGVEESPKEEVKTEPAAESAPVQPPPDPAPKDGTAEQDEPGQSGQSLPAASFESLVFSLASAALMYLGEFADPEGKSAKDLGLAKQTIDLLGVLSEKTKGNLTKEEEAFLSNNLRDLRLRFVIVKK